MLRLGWHTTRNHSMREPPVASIGPSFGSASKRAWSRDYAAMRSRHPLLVWARIVAGCDDVPDGPERRLAVGFPLKRARSRLQAGAPFWLRLRRAAIDQSRRIGLLLSVLCLAAGTAQAQPKIAVIDLPKVFNQYYKTIQADATLKHRGAEFEKTKRELIGQYAKARKACEQLISDASDPAVSAQEQAKRKSMKRLVVLIVLTVDGSFSARAGPTGA
ncbi:MAG: OmpH/Skp family outer membrane protein [Limisphaerales bacterium]